MDSDPTAKTKKRRVLVVDDEPLIRWSLTERLRDDGWIVQTAASVVTCRQALATGQWDLLICDVKLPDGSGMDVLRELQTNRAAPPVLMITAHGDATVRAAAMSAGAIALIDKPFDIDMLAAQARVIADVRG